MNLFLQLLLSYLFAHFCLLCFCFLFLLSLLSVVLIVFHIPLYSPTSLLVWKSWCAAQSCPTLCDPMNCSLPGSSVHGILQAGILKWVAISFSRRSSWPSDRTYLFCIAGRFLTIWATDHKKEKFSIFAWIFIMAYYSDIKRLFQNWSLTASNQTSFWTLFLHQNFFSTLLGTVI